MLAQDHMFSHYGVIITPPFLQCKVESLDGIIGECKKCGILMKMKRGVKCVIAKVLIFDGDEMILVINPRCACAQRGLL